MKRHFFARHGGNTAIIKPIAIKPVIWNSKRNRCFYRIDIIDPVIPWAQQDRPSRRRFDNIASILDGQSGGFGQNRYSVFQNIDPPNSTIHHDFLDILFPTKTKKFKKAISITETPDSTPTATLQTRTLIKTSTSYDGKNYVACAGQPEYTISEIVIPPHYELPKHTHPMPIFGVVLSGEIVLVNHETGERQLYRKGTVIAELVDTVHHGYTGEESCTLLVFYAGAVGQSLSVHSKEDQSTKQDEQHDEAVKAS